MLFGITGCGVDDPGHSLVQQSIEVHGGDRFEEAEIRFGFRGQPFAVIRQGGRFHYERSYEEEGVRIREWMTNDQTRRMVDGEPVTLDEEGRARVELDLNSVVYFALLPFRLMDPAVRHRELAPTDIEGEPYRVVEVTFQREGGGEDWEDRFVYWFHADDHTLDFMAYRYDRGDGGTRFRRAVNRREVGELLLQDYQNFTANEGIEDIVDYPLLLAEGRLELVSMVEMEDVAVLPPPSLPLDGPVGVGEASDEGVELIVGMERLEYEPGEAVRVALQLANRLDRERVLHFRSGQRYDLVVFAEDDSEVFRWSDERSFTQALGQVQLGPGDDGPMWEEEIPAPEAPGQYRLRATVTADDTDLVAEVPLEVR